MRNFQASPACAEFLGNLPEDRSSLGPVELGSALRSMTLDGTSSSSPPAPSRFLILQDAWGGPKAEVEGRVTMTTLLVPSKVDSILGMLRETFLPVFGYFLPRGSEFFDRIRGFSFKYSAVWMWAVAEDYYMQEKFRKPEPAQLVNQDRTIFYHFFLWPRKFNAAPEREEASAADPQAKESWVKAVSKVMPPVTAWTQERWEIQKVPYYYPPEYDEDDEDDEDLEILEWEESSENKQEHDHT